MKPIPKFDYPIHTLLQQRWSPRAFSDKRISRSDVNTLLEAARWAASGMNIQPWRFVWSFHDGSMLYNKLFSCLASGNQEWVITAPLLMLTLVDLKLPDSEQANPWARHDLGLAIGNMITQATSMGIYAHNMGGFSVDKVRESFPKLKDLEPVTMIALGYLGDPSILSEFNQQREMEIQVRKPLSEIDLSDRV